MQSNMRVTIFLAVLAVVQPSAAAVETFSAPAEVSLQAWLAPLCLVGEKCPLPLPGGLLRDVARFYREVGFKPVWINPDDRSPQERIELSAIGGIAGENLLTEGVRLSRPAQEITHDAGIAEKIRQAGLDPDIESDVLLTARMLQFARHLYQGRVVPETLLGEWLACRRVPTRDIPIDLARAVIEGRLSACLESLEPSTPAYRNLKEALVRYRAIQSVGGWPVIAPGPILRIGDRHSRVDALIDRLIASGDLPADAVRVPAEYDTAVQAAVKRFQRRHGLAVDGVVGRLTLSELNIAVEARIDRLRLNMERWHWFPDSLGERYLIVNIPAFELQIVEAGISIDRMRAIVGKHRRQTPVMSERMTYLEFNPYWNIPRKIARRDILPKVIGDPDYLTRQGIRVFDGWDHEAREMDPARIAWQNLSARDFPYRLRQDPSDSNALGRIKFMFPNRLSVYIHDTPGKSLFNRQERSFSSGCVRVENPLALAQYLLRRQGWNQARLESAISPGPRRTVILEHPIAVHLVYFTAWVDDDGTVQFRRDIYGRDRDLSTALGAQRAGTVFCDRDTLERLSLAVFQQRT